MTARQRLAEAIQAVNAANAYWDRVAQAIEAHFRTSVYRAIDAAEASLKEAKRDAPAALVQALLAGQQGDGDKTLRRAERAVAAARDEVARHEAEHAALERERVAAKSALERCTRARDESLAAVLAEAPGISALVGELHAAQQRAVTLEATLNAISKTAVYSCLPDRWNFVRDYRPDPEPGQMWIDAIQALRQNPHAELPPANRTVTRIERTIVKSDKVGSKAA